MLESDKEKKVLCSLERWIIERNENTKHECIFQNYGLLDDLNFGVQYARKDRTMSDIREARLKECKKQQELKNKEQTTG